MEQAFKPTDKKKKAASLKKLHASNMKVLNKDELQTAEAVLLKHLPKSLKVDGGQPFKIHSYTYM